VHDGDEGSGSFSKTFLVSPGTYQYKFRLGTGDWWVVDETQKTGQPSCSYVCSAQPKDFFGAAFLSVY
jgi:hypothetical protein